MAAADMAAAAATTLATTISLGNARECAATGIGNAPDITATEPSNGMPVCTNLRRWQTVVDTDVQISCSASTRLQVATPVPAGGFQRFDQPREKSGSEVVFRKP
jgi:hypothetical protein